MTSEQKVSLVGTLKGTYGLNLALGAVDLPKSTWYYHQNHKVSYEEKYAYLLPVLETIARAHPEYGVPRIMPELRDEHGYDVNQPSSVQQAIIEVGERANLVAQMKEIGLFQVLYTDFTELLYADGHRKAILMPIVGHASKMAFGWAVGQSADTVLALQAWERAKETFQCMALPYPGMIMHHDRDPVYTGYEWTSQLLLKDELRISYALRGAKDNPEMESFNGRFKTEGHSLFLEAQSFTELITVVDERMRYYNTERRHSSIGYVPPLTCIKRARSEGEK